jgi:hypothetical protein
MFSPNAQEFSKLVDVCFITGISSQNIKKYLSFNDSNLLKADCLCAFPEGNDLVTPSIMEVRLIKLKYSLSSQQELA